MLLLAEDHAGRLDVGDTRTHVLRAQRHPGSESPLDRVGAHGADDRVAVFG